MAPVLRFDNVSAASLAQSLETAIEPWAKLEEQAASAISRDSETSV